LGRVEELQRQEMWVRNVNLVKYAALPEGIEALTKIRYKDPGTLSNLIQEGNRVHVNFYDKVSAVAPGQSAVFYEGNDLLGGGFIERSKF
jgi:tRNA-specific 2-thiouridylase